MTLKNWSLAECPFKSLVDGTSDYWTASGSGTNEYYYNQGDVDEKPKTVEIDGSAATEGTLGSLAAGEWGWGDNDTLGSDTVYVRLSGGGDPDAQSAGHVECSEPVEVLQVTAAKSATITSVKVSNNTTSLVTFDLLDTDSGDTITFPSRYLEVAEGDRLMVRTDIDVFTDEQKLKIHSDAEDVGVKVSGMEEDE